MSWRSFVLLQGCSTPGDTALSERIGSLVVGRDLAFLKGYINPDGAESPDRNITPLKGLAFLKVRVTIKEPARCNRIITLLKREVTPNGTAFSEITLTFLKG